MKYTPMIGVALLLSAAALPGVARGADPPRAADRTTRGGARAQQGSGTYLASGPAGEADLARLRDAIGKLPGVTKVETRAEEDSITVTIAGDGASSGSILVAAAKAAGYRMRPAPTRFYQAAGPNGEEDLARLRTALSQIPGMEQLALTRLPEGAAVRVGGAARHPALVAAGKDAGFTLRVLTSYVASGPSKTPDLARLRAALGKVPGVEQVEMRGLVGGATLLIYGPANEERLSAAGKSAGYIVWPLGSAEGGREFRIQGPADMAARDKLSQALKEVEGIGEIDIRDGPDGIRLVVDGGQARPPAILAAASEAGFTLTPVQTVTLPSVVPQANRNTPPDYENRVLEDQARPGEPAPPFSLLDKDGVTPIHLADLLGKRPVVLLFGSCT